MNTLLEELKRNSEISLDLQSHLERQEAGDAELFALLLRDRIVFDHAAKAWYVWRGHHWQRDQIGQVRRMIIQRLAPEYMRAAALALEEGHRKKADAFSHRAKSLWHKSRIENVLSLTQNIDGVALIGTEWDLDPMLLGVQNGVINLETGVYREGQPNDYLRHYAPVEWLGLDYPAPQWDQFLFEVFDGRLELVSFTQRMFGYCITGLTTEHILPIFYGEAGRNGKTTLLETVASVLGNDLAHITPADTLMDLHRNSMGAQPFIHALRGRRLVWATESREGHRLNNGLIKQLTGGDSITARALYEGPLTFAPTHKVILLTNHKPHLNVEDQALWERVLLLPLETRFVDHPKLFRERKRNPYIRDALQREKPGILAWLVQGCLAWRKEGLNLPADIRVATEAYRREEDTLSEFYAECLIQGSGLYAQAKDIYLKYVEWARSNDMEVMSKIALGKRLARRFGHPDRNMNGMIYKGVKIA